MTLQVFTDSTSVRGKLMFLVIAAMFSIFLVRLVQLQILFKDMYGRKSEENSVRPLMREPVRGYIFDRNGKLIVDNRPSYSVTLTPSEFHKNEIPYVAKILQVDSQFIVDRIRKGVFYNRFAPIRLKRDVDFATLSLIEENRDRLPGIDYQIETKRFYPTKSKAPHLFGYTKEVSERQIESHPDEFRPGDVVGANGIEAAYEKNLRGQRGVEFMTVNARGQVVGNYNDGKNDIKGREGDDLYLAIDAGVQALAESLLADKHGAVVAIDPDDGGIIALVSKPDFDPDLLSGFTPESTWNKLNTDPARPLFNRATLTRYPPGSTFKMVLAAAALQEGFTNTDYRVNCTGGFRFGNHVFKDLHVHGSTNVIEAIQRSCNVFFYGQMLKVGFENWTHYGQEFGFGSPTGIDIGEENPGLLPSKQYFDKVYGKGKWTNGYLVSLGIGQGELGVSPLQMACYAMALGNKGKYYRPHVVRRIRDKQTGQLLDVPVEERNVNVSEKVFDIIKEGMYRCINLPGGTGAMAKVKDITVAGKTGTAENPHGKDHAWFIGFAPADHPKIAICALVENAGFGGVFAAPIAGMCIEQYLYGELIRNKKTPPAGTTPAAATTTAHADPANSLGDD